MNRVQLNSDLVGPETDEFDRIERASDIVSDDLRSALGPRGLMLHWSWGDSRNWRVILGIATEAKVNDLISSREDNDLARQIAAVIGRTVDFKKGFRLYLEIDSDERVNANEGWFLRTRGNAPRGRELVFAWNGESFSRA